MAELRWLKIGDICTIEKGVTGLVSATPGKYPLVATGADRRSAQSFQFDTKAVCIPLVSSTGHGKKSLNHVHYQEGKFALGTILAALIPKDEKVLDARYLHTYLKMNKDRVLVPLMKGAANVSLSISAISDVNIPVPSLTEQKDALAKLDSMSKEHAELLLETDKQLKLLKQLRQQLLQDAIQGKLTADWRKNNPQLITKENHALELLKKINAEKSHLIKEGRLKKEKYQLPITESKKPFPLPESWVWCKLRDASIKIHYGFNASGRPEIKEVRLLRITDIQDNQVAWDNVPGCKCSAREMEAYLLSNNDIVIARTGGTIGKSFLIKSIPVKSLFASYLIRIVPSKHISAEYLKLFLESPDYWRQLYDAAWGAQPNVSGTSLSKLHLPLPSMAEQLEIIKTIDHHTQLIRTLTDIAAKQQSHIGELMQSVLREAFKK